IQDEFGRPEGLNKSKCVRACVVFFFSPRFIPKIWWSTRLRENSGGSLLSSPAGKPPAMNLIRWTGGDEGGANGAGQEKKKNNAAVQRLCASEGENTAWFVVRISIGISIGGNL